METTAKVVAVLPVESGTARSGKEWRRQGFVMETGGRYPMRMCFQLFGDKVADCPAVGEEVKVSFDIESREYNGRWYTQLNAWKVEKPGTPQPAPAQQGWQAACPQQRQDHPAQEDNLPF